MLYWLYEQLSAGGHIPVLNLLKYLTFRTGMALFTAQLVVVLLGSRFIRFMQAKQGKGQPIRKEGIERHVIEKAGTPTMGGVMILAGLLVELSPRFAGAVRPGGWIILSGILAGQADAVTAAYRAWFDIALTATRDGWGLLSGRRRADY